MAIGGRQGRSREHSTQEAHSGESRSRSNAPHLRIEARNPARISTTYVMAAKTVSREVVNMIERDFIQMRASGLDRLSNTFTRDQEFCESLAALHPWNVGRLFVYLRWAQNYLPPIQEELLAMIPRHFSAAHSHEARFWTLSLCGGIFKDLGLIPYLIVRGLIWDAGFALRRSLENAGLLAHLWQEPGKVEHLLHPESGPFKNAFVSEVNKDRAYALKTSGIQKRFAACSLGKPMSDLYKILSTYSIHGGSPSQHARSQLEPTRVSCMLVNRPDPLEKSLGQDLEIFANGSEILCTELVFVHGTFGRKYSVLRSKGGEGGFYFTKLLDRGSDSEMSRLVQATLHDLGWLNHPGP